MTADFNPDTVVIENFHVLKQIQFFHALKLNRFSGQLSFQNYQNLEWIFYFYLGRVIYATGGRHPVRRWRRNLVLYFPEIAQRLQQELNEINLEKESKIYLTWDYHLLYLWFEQKKIHLEQITNYIRALTNEILFDLTQADTIAFYLTSVTELLFQPLAMIDAEQQITITDKIWQQWQKIDLQGISPDLAPNIIDQQKLQKNTSEKTYQILQRLLDGKHSIRDLAVQKQANELMFVRSLLPYMKLEAIQFLAIRDLPYPVAQPEFQKIIYNTKNSNNAEHKSIIKLKIACITANKMMMQLIDKVVKQIANQLIFNSEPLEAMVFVLEEKPDIILLDLDLSNFNGYELCSSLRQIDSCNQTPIILFSKNIGLVEKMKAKMSGASELFQQSMDIKSLMRMIQKYVFILTLMDT